MILLSDIKGESSAVQFLLGSLSSGRIASSYLFTGSFGAGQAACAKAFAAALICPTRAFSTSTVELDSTAEVEKGGCGICSSCQRVDKLEHPDILWIKPEVNEAIKIDEVRQIKERLSLKPYESGRNVCVIEDAHMMTQEASNALLKILEEPPASSHLILITHKKELLLETVVSRCVEVRFQSMPFDIVKEDKERFISFMNNLVKEKELSCLNWESDNKDKLLLDIEMFIIFFREVAFGKENLEEKVLDKDIINTNAYRFFRGYSIDKIYEKLSQLVDMRLALLGNINPKLVAQVLPGMLK